MCHVPTYDCPQTVSLVTVLLDLASFPERLFASAMAAAQVVCYSAMTLACTTFGTIPLATHNVRNQHQCSDKEDFGYIFDYKMGCSGQYSVT